MQTVTIPQGFKPFKVTINYQDYEFEPGKEYQVADDVYEQIKRYIAGMELPEGIIGDPFAPYDVVIRYDMVSDSNTEPPKFTLLKGSYKLVKNRILNRVPVNGIMYSAMNRRDEGEDVPSDKLITFKIERFNLENHGEINRIIVDFDGDDVSWYPATDTEPEKIQVDVNPG